MIDILLEPFKYDFMIRSLITAIASGAMLSILGPFAINRNMGFMADAMAHATLPIIAVGVFLGFSIFLISNIPVKNLVWDLRKEIYLNRLNLHLWYE